MGTLDDAIRQHLDLKRRRGATDSELQRLEDEAFGPPSRPGEPDFPEQESQVVEQSGNGAVAEAHGEPDEHDSSEAQTTIHDEGAGAELELAELEVETGEEEAPAAEAAVAEEPADAATPEPPIEALDTVEHQMPEEPAPEEPAPHEGEASAESEPDQQRDDMLADTPEFLRDAPEDDELWFEQGKPKEFDF
jgi:hypothetical protein